MTAVLEAREAEPRDAAFGLGLRAYLAEVAEAFGVGLESCTMETEPRASAYVALDWRPAGLPDREMALLWDEVRGWSVVAEFSGPGRDGDSVVLAVLGGDVLAPAADVAAATADVRDGRPPRPLPVPPAVPLTERLRVRPPGGGV
ncbi:DUF6292 family protein [Allokutzneria albata]|uniref:DUF6292 domain-containing protein n=1 Tax=Allokutzneria albata TaxID=211114 RepID=A0A1G9RU49_ALLAB|nr:DUF6292 family protein [Allokutzneria albata]SDM26600.1 hypothetical protein SAMN04489726_0677 [Allokutzneria albata]